MSGSSHAYVAGPNSHGPADAKFSFSVTGSFGQSISAGVNSATQAPEDARAKRPITNSTLLSGYLIYRLWPSIRVFDDGRTDFYGPRFVEEGLRTWEACPDWATVLARFQVNAALLPIDSTLATVLRERTDWRPIYTDRVAVLFIKAETPQ